MRLRIIYIFTLLSVTLASSAQGITLKQAINLAKDSALTIYISQHQKECEEALYNEFQALRKPQLNLNVFQDNDVINQRQDTRYVSNSDYRYLSWGGTVELTQQLLSWGGEFYANTRFWHTYSVDKDEYGFYSDDTYRRFTQAYAPITIGYRNTLLGFNQHKWDLRIQDAKMEYARQAAKQEMFAAAEEVVRLYMNLITAQTSCKIDKRNYESTDSIYQVGKEKYTIAFVTQGDLMSLEVATLNAANKLEASETKLRNATIELASYLHCAPALLQNLPIPDCSDFHEVKVNEALALAEANNPQLSLYRQKLTEAQSDRERSKRQEKLTADVDFNVGYQVVRGHSVESKSRDVFAFVGGISVNVPLIDHGAAHQRVVAATQKIAEQETGIRECQRTIRRDIEKTIISINDKRQLITKVEKAFRISEDLFNLNTENYAQGLCDLNTFLLSQSHRDSAYSNYISAIADYFIAYAHLRTLTLSE